MDDILIYYALTQPPFLKNTQLPGLFQSEEVLEIKGRLNYLIQNRGVGVFTGEAGSGKTSIIREFVRSLNPSLYHCIYIQMTSVSSAELFRQIARGLGLDPGSRKSDIFRQVQDEISRLAAGKGCTPLIIIDEAQYLRTESLRDLVMLLNFDMDSRDDCILILSGLNLLNAQLRKPVNEALRQRVIVNYHANGLTRKEAGQYVQYVLKACGTLEPLFSEEAIEAAYKNSQGSIRQLNRILSSCLKQGAAEKIRSITAETVRLACEEIDLS